MRQQSRRQRLRIDFIRAALDAVAQLLQLGRPVHRGIRVAGEAPAGVRSRVLEISEVERRHVSDVGPGRTRVHGVGAPSVTHAAAPLGTAATSRANTMMRWAAEYSGLQADRMMRSYATRRVTQSAVGATMRVRSTR